MVYMRRSEILQEYGVDPLVEDAADDAGTPRFSKIPLPREVEAQTPLPAPKPNVETATAPLVNNMVAGAAKGFSSDPMMLYGLGAALIDYAKSDKDKKFVDAIYAPGGLEKVSKHLQERADALREEHPEWPREQILSELEKYQATPEFFEVNTANMRSGLSGGLRSAYAINKATGVDKLPSQETIWDEVTQILGSVLVPVGGLGKLAGAAEQFAARIAGQSGGLAARGAVHALDAIVVPGTRTGAYGVPAIALGTGVGTGITEGRRYLMDEPSLLNGKAIGSPLPASNENWLEGIGLGGALGLGLFTAGAAMRGRLRPPDVNTAIGGGTGKALADQVEDAKIARGFEPDATQPTLRQDLDEALNTDSPIESLTRRIGGNELEDDAQAILGTMMSPNARTVAFDNWFQSGRLPDGMQGVRARDFQVMLQDTPETSVQKWFDGDRALNELDVRQEVLNISTNRMAKAQTELNSALASGDQRRITAAQKEMQAAVDRMNAHVSNDPATRHAFPQMDDAALRKAVADMEADPAAKRLMDMKKKINKDLADLEHRAGLISSETHQQRLNTLHHTSLFESNVPAGGSVLDAGKKRGADYEFDVPRAVVEQSIDPFASIMARAASVIDHSKLVMGQRNLLRMLRSADPGGKHIQYMGRVASYPNGLPTTGHTVRVPVNGVEHAWQFASPAVARAFNQAPIDLGMALNFANSARRLYQLGTTGPLSVVGAVRTAFRSNFYDALGAYVARPAGTSFSMGGSLLRRITSNTGLTSATIDKIERIDPSFLAQMPGTLAMTGAWKTWGWMGQRFMDAAIRENTGALSLINKLPGGNKFLRDTGAQMWRAFEASPIGVMKRFDGYSPHAMMIDTFGRASKIEQAITQFAQGGKQNMDVLTPLQSIARTWMSMLDTVHNNAKLTYIAQNIPILEAKYPKGIPAKEMRKLVDQTRRLSGDMQGTPGAAPTRAGAALWPYLNQMMQATRYLAHAFTTQGLNQSLNVATSIAGLVGAMYASHKLIEGMGLKDWYYEKLNDWDRIGTLWYPTFEAMVHRARTGAWPQANPENPTEHLERVKLVPEHMLLIQPAMAGLEAFGLIDRGRNLSRSTPGQDMLKATGNSIGVGNFPPLNMALNVMGNRSDALQMLEGRAAVSNIKGPRGQGVFTGDHPSGIPAWAGELAQTVLGLNGKLLVQATDAGAQKFQKSGGDFIAAASRAIGEVKQEFVNNAPNIPGLWKAEEKVYLGTPTSRHLYDLGNQMKVLDEQYRNEFTASRIPFKDRPRIQDPDVKRMVALAHAWFEKGGYKKYEEVVDNTKKKYEALSASKGRNNPETIIAEQRSIQKVLSGQQERLAMLAARFEDRLKSSYGQRFQAEGLEPNLSGLIELTKRTTK